MSYELPQNITIDEVRAAIASANSRLDTRVFIEADRDEFVIFNYLISFPEVFPHPSTGDAATDREYAILRECRGLTFHKDGRIAARKFHKFFNVGEKPETMPDVIDWSKPHGVLVKEDGSMITPFVGNNGLEWHTKMGNTDVAKLVWPFIDRLVYMGSTMHYIDFVHECVESGLTPLFEFCSRSQRIVVDHPVDRMPLLAIRDNATGLYLSYESIIDLALGHNIPVVGVHSSSNVGDIEQFLAGTADETGIEGYIIAFDDGHRLKVKTDEYRTIHRVVSDLASEKSVIRMIVEEKLDDALPILSTEDRDAVAEFARLFSEGISATALVVLEYVKTGSQVANNQREFAEFVTSRVPERLRPLAFRSAAGRDLQESILELISKHMGSGPRLDTVRDLWGGHRWEWGAKMETRLDEG